MSGLRARVVPVASLGPDERARMWALFAAAYDDVDEATFRADLDAKQRVIVLTDADGVQGFSTLREVEVTVDGQRQVGMFSGDTVVAPAYWGTKVLGRAFLAHLAWRRMLRPLTQYWWVLITKGYKTYLLMANNFPVHWPRMEAPTPPEAERLRDAFGEALFGAAWRAQEGVVRWDAPRGRLRAGVADAAEASHLPRVAFFERSNPGWAQGDELLCLARMDLVMPVRYALKAWGIA